MEIAILSEFLSNLCGVSVKENMTLYQILGQGGGGTLRAQIIDSSHFKEKVRRQMPAIDNVLKSNSMLVAFLISVAQKKQLLIFKGRTHVKALGNLVDKHQDVLLQLVEYIAANPALKKRLRLTLPSMEELKTKYYLTSEDIFLIYRPLFEGISFVEPKNVEKANEVGGEANNAVSTSSDNRVESGSFSPTASVDHLSKEIEFKNALLDSVSSLLPASAVSSLSRSFYAAFWAHSLYDIYVPHQQYDSALESLSKQTTKGGSERKKLLKCKDALTSERDKQVENHKIVMSKFSEDKDKWFENCSYGEESISAFLQYCILPRVICSDYDAVYCSKFLAIVHQLSTPGFYTSLFFHWLVEILPTFVATCTQKEAMRFGLFVHDVLALLHHWRSTEVRNPKLNLLFTKDVLFTNSSF